jgi:hypothetical protein
MPLYLFPSHRRFFLELPLFFARGCIHLLWRASPVKINLLRLGERFANAALWCDLIENRQISIRNS